MTPVYHKPRNDFYEILGNLSSLHRYPPHTSRIIPANTPDDATALPIRGSRRDEIGAKSFSPSCPRRDVGLYFRSDIYNLS